MQQSPIFTHLHDLLLWLIPATRKFPREHRFGLAQRLQDQGFDLQHALIAAVYDKRHTEEHLIEADVLLTDLRKTLLLCQELGLLQDGQYRHVSQIVANIGNRLGSWRNPEKEKSAQPKHRIADAGAGPG